jgi:SpoVK/Ycf46/Vps4 family AAA+-type ATPase
MSNQDLRTAWRRMLNSTPCIALFEDLDAVFVERENVAAKNMGMMGGGGLTFDCLINCLDGIERADGVLLIVTTNRLELLDDAIIKRPGRVDHVVEFQPLDQEGRRKMALRILEDTETADQMSRLHTEDTAAQFQERCFQVALSRRFDPGVTARLRVQKD